MTGRCTRTNTTCLRQLAEGWITASDLCPGCTARFMVALDHQAGEALSWHQKYLDRAEGVTVASVGAEVAELVARARIADGDRHNAVLSGLVDDATELLGEADDEALPPTVTDTRNGGHDGRGCAGCGRPLTGVRPDARYCSGACRQRAYRVRGGAGTYVPFDPVESRAVLESTMAEHVDRENAKAKLLTLINDGRVNSQTRAEIQGIYDALCGRR